MPVEKKPPGWRRSRMPDVHRQRMARLAMERMHILSLPPEKAVKAILDSDMSTALVHFMPVEDFYFLIHEIGPDDCLEILGMASARQWEFFLDMDTWERDRPKTGAMTEWLNRFFLADPIRFVPWIWNEKPELVEYYLRCAIEVRLLEENEDPSDFEDGFFTHDGMFYVRIIPEEVSDGGIYDPTDQPDDPDEGTDTRTEFITRFLSCLVDEDIKRYQFTLLSAMAVNPAESEENGFRLKNVRLAERGFLPFDEAVGVYAPMGPGGAEKRRSPLAGPMDNADSGVDFLPPVPMGHVFMLNAGTIFSDAIMRMGEGIVTDELLSEFATLCNRIIAADQVRITDRRDLRHVVEKACGYLSIGLFRVAGEKPTPDRAASLLSAYPLSEIFRTGFQAAIELKARAAGWKKQGWFLKNGLPLTFWGERLTGYIGGLLLARPRFYDNYETGRLYREFESVEDVLAAGAALDSAMAFDALFSKMDVDVKQIPKGRFVTHENLLLTLWARKRAGLSPIPVDMDMASFRKFFVSLWTESEPRRVSDAMKTDFLRFLAQKSGQADYDVSESLGQSLEWMFAGLEEELAAVSPDDLDQRFIHMFFIDPADNG